MDVRRGGGVAALADGSVGEEFADEWDALLPVERGSLRGAGPEAGPSLERCGSSHACEGGAGVTGLGLGRAQVGAGMQVRPPAGL
jgi:hypothetical protein